MLGIVVALALSAAAPEARFDLQTATLSIDAKGCVRLQMNGDGQPWSEGGRPILQAVKGQETIAPESVLADGDRLRAQFADGSVCEFSVRPGNGFAIFDLVRFEFASPIELLRLFTITLPQGAEVMSTLNAGGTPTHIAAVSAAEPNVHAFTQASGRYDSDRLGCTHELVRTDQAKAGIGAARFTATCDAQPEGWSVSSYELPQPLNLTGLKAIRAWVHGDGKGELLKIQLCDGFGGYRDTYIPIRFEGWQPMTIAESSVNTLRFNHVASVNLYYNGLPAGQTVSCIVDQVEAILEKDGAEAPVVLEDFEPASGFWVGSAAKLNVETSSHYGIQPARFGVIAGPRGQFMEAMARFEDAAGLPSPKLGGVWNKQSPWIKRSYLFITSFNESQFEPVLALARRGGFDMILLHQESWTRSTGHYAINTDAFPGGLEALARTCQRFKQEKFHVGLHFLGPSIYPPDPYLTPVPDLRLVRDGTVHLAADIDDRANQLPTETAPDGFPAEDGGYMGEGSVVQIDDELMSYGVRAIEAPFGFRECTRGILGTVAAPHAKGQTIRHLKRSYGYFLFDIDSSLLDEVSSNFATVANACDIDMIYFDGSERLQGDHWYYNARLHKAFFDKLARKDILIQASSYSHYSWHILARSASADGHGDLKGYLDERSAWLDAFKRDAMPLDIGWYYGYDPNCPPDMYEYVLGASIGYDSSMSFQVSLETAMRHPFTGEILDLISRYEKLRLSGRVPDDMRARLRIDPVLAGLKKDAERSALLDRRREYRLLGEEGHEAFQRVVYDAWHDVSPADPVTTAWPFSVKDGGAKIGVQFHVQPGPWLEAGPSYGHPDALVLESFDDLAPYLANRGDRSAVRVIMPGEGGATLPGVTQNFSVSDQDAKQGTCGLYSAESALNDNSGWSVIGKSFNPPLDLSWHRAIGFWLRGDGKGGQFKLQLLDGAQAADFYIANDYAGWRYQQLARPQADPIDYSRVTTLNLYYNGLPSKTAVCCAIDDIKALRNVDAQTLANPWMEVDGHRLGWTGSVSQGQYVFLWPGEPARCYGPAFHEPTGDGAVTETVELGPGEHIAQFGCDGKLLAPIRARVTIQPAERYEIP